jgi:hypothetical protein
MKNVRWPDNNCTVGGTCIHGFFTKADLEKLFELCPNGSFTPTFYHERLGPRGFSKKDLPLLDTPYWHGDTTLLSAKEFGYYFTFMEHDGLGLIAYLKSFCCLRKGEPCWP